MKRISQTPQAPINLQQDDRHDPHKIGKYLYLGALGLFLLTIVHILLGHWYILQGNGFVYSENQIAALEFDATIQEVFVKEGQFIEKQEPLFTFDSLALKTQLIQAAYQLSTLQQNTFSAEQSMIQLTNQIQSTKKFTEFSQKLAKSLDELLERKVISPLQMSPDAQRLYEAMSALASYQAEYAQTRQSLGQLKENLKKAQKYYDELVQYYEEGIFRAPEAGTVTELSVWPGSVLSKSATALRLFHGQRYILGYVNADTWVSYRVGDKLLVSVTGERTHVGKITHIFGSSEPLPAEFQPPFKPAQRNQLIAIELKSDALEQMPVMTTAQISKPLGFWLVSWLF